MRADPKGSEGPSKGAPARAEPAGAAASGRLLPVGVDGLDVLLVTRGLEMAAATLTTISLGGALAAEGLRVRAVSAGGPFEPVLRERGVPIDIVPHLSTAGVGWWARRRLARRLGRGRVAVVHSISLAMLDPARSLARALGAPLVLTVHSFAGKGARPVDWSGVAACLVTHDALRQDVVNQRRCPRDRVRVVHAGVAIDYEPLGPFAERAAPVVGTIAELDKLAVQEQFLRAAREVLAREPGAQFLMVGEGPDPARLRALIDELGVRASVTFAPVMDLRKSLPIMDVCVLPSAEEGAGPALLEAMVAGRPVISAGKGGAYTAIRDEETGLLVERDAPGGLSAAILRLLEDRELARRLGREARAYALDNFPVEQMVEDTLAVYRQVVSGRGEVKP